MNLWRKVSRAIRYRLVLQKLIERVLVTLGIRIRCYYWVQEGLSGSRPQDFPPNLDDCTFQAFGPDEIRAIATQVPWRSETELLQRLDEGMLCFGIKHRGQIAGFVWCDLAECTYLWRRGTLRDNEVYLFDQFTLEAYRGKNIAACLLSRTYEALRGMGRDTFYSVVEHFNSPAVRVRRKVNARFLELAVGIDLFGKVRRHYIVRRYPHKCPVCISTHEDSRPPRMPSQDNQALRQHRIDTPLRTAQEPPGRMSARTTPKSLED
ncbi:MAG TPA: GNAT family N-acetyltransferase [Sedimentisphaerales bacterium]|nr:GNAT family N-acetyltransferase [Sedimentisphaerales bacterium]HRS11760.1 GNAT family N-acetyltransferase [Sedimentisphaerales bacterium]HRV48421.1 GNAT family N-acetyltransferase [Sedimentisphaerales bacterium]